MAIVTSDTNLSAVTYAAGEIIEIRNGATLTVSATPATRPGTFQCITSGKLRIENASSTVPLVLTLNDMDNDFRFEANGVMEVRGAPMSLAAGTGAAQTWNFATLFGGVIPQVNYVEVEESAGSGVFMPWPVIQEDPKFNLDTGLSTTVGGASPASFTAGNTDAGRVLFWHETDRTLRCGDGTQGAVVPAGCAVRVPNIYITNRQLTNQTRVLSVGTQGTPTGGTFAIEISRENGTVLGTTAAIAFNATAAVVDAAIEAVTGVGTVTSGGGPLPTAVSVTWAGIYASERLGTRIVSAALTGGTNPTAYTIENSTANLSLVDLNPLGTLDVEWCAFSDKIRFVVDVFKSVRLISVGIGADAAQFNSSNGSVEIDGLANSRSPFVSQSGSQIASVLGAVSAKRIVSAGKNPVGFSLFTLPNLTTVDRITAFLYGQRTATSNAIIALTTIPANLKLTNLTTIGARINLTNLTGCTLAGWKYADGTLSAQTTLQAGFALVTVNCTDCTLASYSDAGPMSPRAGLISTDAASARIKVLGGSSDGSNNLPLLLAMGCGGAELSNFSIANVRGGPFIDLPTNYLANNLLARKVFSTYASSQGPNGLDACQGGHYDMVTSTIAGITETFAGVNDFVGGNYTEPSLTPTTGHVTFGPFGAGVGLEFSGAAYTDALGGVLLPNSGDTAVATIPFAMHGITGFQNVAPYLYVDAPGAAANVGIVAAPGIPTGGTFTITIADAAGTVLGTTAPIAFNAAAATAQAAVQAVVGAGNATVAGTSVGGGYTITGAGIYAGQGLIVSCNGAALTGGTEPGVAYAYGRARLLTGVESLGSITVAEFAMRVPGSSWPAYSPLTSANVVAAFAALSGYSAGGSGLEMRLRLTAGQNNPFTRFNQISVPTTVDASLWVVGDATINLQGPNPTDVTRVIRASDNTVLYSFTGGGSQSFTVGSNFDVPVYFRREDAGGTILMRTLPATQKIKFGDNGTVSLFYGAEVQLAQASSLVSLDAIIRERLDATISGVADAILARNLAGGSNGGRTVRDALRSARNRVVIDPASNTMTVYAEDDSTVAWTATIVTGARDALNAVDPA